MTAISTPYHPAILQLQEVCYVEEKSLHLMTDVMPGGDLGDAFELIETMKEDMGRGSSACARAGAPWAAR